MLFQNDGLVLFHFPLMPLKAIRRSNLKNRRQICTNVLFPSTSNFCPASLFSPISLLTTKEFICATYIFSVCFHNSLSKEIFYSNML